VGGPWGGGGGAGGRGGGGGVCGLWREGSEVFRVILGLKFFANSL
jgi:hypothetical protein